ncbi:hypothetical protein WMF11_17955 [Sorangium sp. So ce295]|uniref:hypothetical protein n=1 Tax=Sorangium sp. So ce295 TaxID=3133295 RepID=UPI003F5D643F
MRATRTMNQGASARPAPNKGAARKAGPGKVVKLGRRAEAAAPLSPGAHFAKLLRKLAEGRYEASLFGGEPREVGVLPEVDLELADRCLAEQGIVLVGMVGDDAVIFGALQTRERRAEEIVLEAPRRLVLKAGKSKLELLAEGRVKLSADAVTVDAPREVRLASAHVEIP